MAATYRNPVQTASNGVITAPAKGAVGGNRKKQKRRAKQAAKAATNFIPGTDVVNEDPDVDYEEDPLGYNEEDDYEYSDAEQHHYHEHYDPSHPPGANGYDMPIQSAAKKNRRKKKKAGGSMAPHDGYVGNGLTSRLPNLPDPPSMAVQKREIQQNIWNTSTQQERQNIKNFWLSLSEEERKSLLKIEKDAVLRKMKQQQKHSCSCTVCGRKRTAIEEELEVLYEGYYEELEQYAHHDHPPLPVAPGMMLPSPLNYRPHPLAAPPPPPPQSHLHHRSSQMLEHLDDEEYSEEEYSDEEEYSEDEPEPTRGPIPDFFNFGQNLTVKDNLLTVADDLLKNDGRKFIEMMEQLAERRMQRENEAEYAAANPSHPGAGYHSNDGGYHNDDYGQGDELDDDEASYDSQEYDDDELEEEDEMSGLTEEQRMQEGRRMFQIFAARMFEHRVLTAYKEKVAAERQQKLLEELQDEEKQEAQREAKKKRDAEKKKDKKKQQQAAKAEEKAKKDAEKAAEEARLKEAEEQKVEEQRRRKEEQRRKKDDEKRKLEEDRLKKEADRARRQQEEQARRDEAERKSRELKAAEKVKKEEARKREREEREAREKTARDRKAQEDLERETKLKSDAAPAQVVKRPSHQNMVAIPGVFPKQPTPGAVASPKSTVATPAIPKAPVAKKQNSQQGSHASSPKQTQSQISSAASKSSSPGAAVPPQHPPGLPKTILQKPSAHPPQGHPMPPVQHQHVQPPPGMSHPQANGFSPLPGMGFPPGHTMPGGMRSPMPMFQHAGPSMPMQGRMASFGAPGMNGMHAPPPGIMPHGRNGGFPFEGTGTSPVAPPGFNANMPQQPTTHTSPIGAPVNGMPHSIESARAALAAHSRHQSINDKFDATIGNPVTRPAPIQRPSSVKPHDADVDDLSKHLGSSALLDDDDEQEQQPLTRRVSQRGGPLDSLGGFNAPVGGFSAPSGGWTAPSPFGQSPGLGQQWSNMPAGSWNSNSFAANNAFGAPGRQRANLQHASSRPLAIRIAVCQACKQLANMPAVSGVYGGDGYHHIDVLMRQIESNRPPLDPFPSLAEIEEICETEGDAQNGGGELQTTPGPKGKLGGVRWRADALTLDIGRQNTHGSLGEIGSPLPTKSTPVIGFGAPGMGRSGGSIGGWPASLGH